MSTVVDLVWEEGREIENDDSFSSSERTATITAVISYKSFGHSFTVRKSAYGMKKSSTFLAQGVPKHRHTG